jgi:hypothetical protein
MNQSAHDNTCSSAPKTPSLSSIDTNLADLIQKAINEAISNALVSLPSTRARGISNPLRNSNSPSGPIPKKLKGQLLVNFKRIFNTAYELHRHRAYFKLAPLRIHVNADKLVEQYNLQAENSTDGLKAQALAAHLKSRTDFLETSIQKQLSFMMSLQQRANAVHLQQAIDEALHRAINETVATRNAIWNEIFQFTSNLAIFSLHELIRSSQNKADQQKIDDFLRLNQLHTIYERRVNESNEHLANGTLPKYITAHALKLPNNHQNTIGEVIYDTIESDWHSANAEAQRILLVAANQLFLKQLERTRELINQHELSRATASSTQSMHAEIIKIKALRSKYSAGANNGPRALPRFFIKLIDSSDEQINHIDQLLNLFRDETNQVDPGKLISLITSRFKLDHRAQNTAQTVAQSPDNSRRSRSHSPNNLIPTVNQISAPNLSTSRIDTNDLFTTNDMDIVTLDDLNNGHSLKRAITSSSSAGLQSDSSESPNLQSNKASASSIDSSNNPKSRRKH